MFLIPKNWQSNARPHKALACIILFIGISAGAVNPAPTATSISPTGGPTGGGTSDTITGTNFVSGATVSFGGVAASNVVVASDTSITATTPAYQAGAVNVMITNPDGQTATLAALI